MFSQTRFSQLLKFIPRAAFNTAVKQSQADRYAKKVSSWDLLVTLLLGQLTQARSLRSLAVTSQSLQPHSYHLNATSLSRSTLSDALQKRSCEPLKAVCQLLLAEVGRKQRRSMEPMISLIDSTCITLRGPRFDDWTLATKTRITQGLKLHVGLDAQQFTPTYVNVTPANINDLSDALQMPIESGVTYVFDKGYCDYNWWHHIDQAGSIFVTRLKKNANVACIGKLSEPEHGIASDEVIRFNKKNLNTKRPNHYFGQDVRRIRVSRDSEKSDLILVTNDFKRSAQEIAALYKQRWQIELFFKWVKQHLKLKYYFGCSENAVRLQIYSALLAFLLLHAYRRQSAATSSIYEFATHLAYSLFERPAALLKADERRRDHAQLRVAMGSLQL
jgi:IS4 transposase